jgi:hypothetical protein
LKIQLAKGEGSLPLRAMISRGVRRFWPGLVVLWLLAIAITHCAPNLRVFEPKKTAEGSREFRIGEVEGRHPGVPNATAPAR